ncbi:hypothetical protein AB3M95_03715 [Metabacillus niabensis]
MYCFDCQTNRWVTTVCVNMMFYFVVT